RAVAELRRRHTERPASVWKLAYDGFDPARQGLREALCAVGNGYFVNRGALGFRVADGPWFDVQQADVLDHRLELDLRQGTLTRYLRWQDADGRRTSVVQRRLVSMKDQHLAGLETTFTAENWSGTILVRSGLDGRVVNAGVKRYRDLNGRHLEVLHA